MKIRDDLECSREEIIEGIRIIYDEWCEMTSKLDGTSKTRLPDFESMLEYIEIFGLPPREVAE